MVLLILESCTQSIATNPGSTEADGIELAGGGMGSGWRACFLTQFLEVITDAGLLWVWWSVFSATGFRGVCSDVFFL